MAYLARINIHKTRIHTYIYIYIYIYIENKRGVVGWGQSQASKS